MLSVFLSWWGRQLLAVLPAAWRRPRHADGPGDGILLALLDGGVVEARRRRGSRETPLGRFALDEAGLRQLRTAVGAPRGAGLRLLLPPRLVLEQQVTLPLAAERGLDTALRWEMDRLTPFPAEAVFWNWTVEARDRERNRLLLRLRLVPKVAVAAVLEALAGAGLRPAWLAAADAPARAVPLATPRARRRGGMMSALAIVFAGLVIAAAAIPFVRQEFELRALAEQIDTLRPGVDAAQAIRKRLADRAASTDVVAAEAARVGDALRILANITEILPDDTFLNGLGLRARTLTITGQSASAARLIPALAADPAVRNPVFAAPVTRNEGTGSETFSIRAEMRP